MPAHLNIQTLGPFQISYKKQPLPVFNSSPRLQALLAFLLINKEKSHTRQQLAFLFWPDSSERQARTNLRKLIYKLRKALPDVDRFILNEGRTLQWNSDSSYCLDLDALRTRITQIKNEPSNSKQYQRAIDLYTGELLPAVYEDWVHPLRENLDAEMQQLLKDYIHLLENRGEYSAGVIYAQKLLNMDPFMESSYRHLMRLQALDGNPAGVVQTYKKCTAKLSEEFGLEPGQATKKLYEQIKRNKFINEMNFSPRQQPQSMIPMFGRSREWQKLRSAFDQTLSGHSHFVSISGEAGIGKTRMVEELTNWAQINGFLAATGHSYDAQGALAMAPVAQLFRQEKIAGRLADLNDTWLVEIGRLVPGLISNRPDLSPPPPLTERWQLRQFFEGLARGILADGQAIILIFEDLQWIDQESLDWLHYLLRFDRQARLMVIGTFRDYEIDADHGLPNLINNLRRDDLLIEIELDRLNKAQSISLAEEILKGSLSADQRDQLFISTEGNPLFLIESVRTIPSAQEERLDSKQSRSAFSTRSEQNPINNLPSKVNAVILSRLGQLSTPAQEVVKLASLIGRSIDYQLLLKVSGETRDNLDLILDELLTKHILSEQTASIYDFSHDLIRQVASRQVSGPKKRKFNRHIAKTMETIYAHRLDEMAGELAVYFENAGLFNEAAAYHQKAALVNQQLGAYQNVINQLSKGIQCVKRLPDSPEHLQQELAMQLNLGFTLYQVNGAGDPAVEKAFKRVKKLGVQLNDPFAQFQAQYGLAIIFLYSPNYLKNRDHAQQCLDIANQTNNLDQKIIGHMMVGVNKFFLGDFAGARVHLELVCHQYYDPAEHNTLAVVYGQDPGVTAYHYLGYVLWFLGYPDQASSNLASAFSLSEKIAHKFTTIVELYASSQFHLFRLEAAEVKARGKLLLEKAQENEMVYLKNAIIVFLNWANTLLGKEDAKIVAEMKQQINTLISKGSEAGYPTMLNMLVQVCLQFGNLEEIPKSIQQAKNAMENNHERFYASETYRLEGQYLSEFNGQRAEEAFLRAIAIAQKQQAKTMELRCTTSLCQLWQQQGKISAAYQRLSSLYNWFEEGFETPDLVNAGQLLSELKSQKEAG